MTAFVASIGKSASAAQGVSCFEKDCCYARGDAAHRWASVWTCKGGAALGPCDPVEPKAFRRVLKGEVPGGRRLGRKEPDGTVNPIFPVEKKIFCANTLSDNLSVRLLLPFHAAAVRSRQGFSRESGNLGVAGPEGLGSWLFSRGGWRRRTLRRQ